MDIKEKLKILGINMNSKGFNYWILAIEFYKQNSKYGVLQISEVYKELAKIFRTKVNNIERCMRQSRIPADEKIKKLYNYNGNITNLTFLKLICEEE